MGSILPNPQANVHHGVLQVKQFATQITVKRCRNKSPTDDACRMGDVARLRLTEYGPFQPAFPMGRMTQIEREHDLVLQRRSFQKQPNCEGSTSQTIDSEESCWAINANHANKHKRDSICLDPVAHPDAGYFRLYHHHVT